jgi:hypothetical protein
MKWTVTNGTETADALALTHAQAKQAAIEMGQGWMPMLLTLALFPLAPPMQEAA